MPPEPNSTWQRPTPADVWRAVDLYLRHAYDGAPPAAVGKRLDALRSLADAHFYGSSVFEHDAVANPGRYNLRLGNRLYPHMKLVIERAPDGASHLFRADTHDRHACPPPASREYAAFCELMAANHAIAQTIEAAWERDQIPTFKAYLRRDLEHRKAT